jgi:two-component system, NarL family, response regulator DevR
MVDKNAGAILPQARAQKSGVALVDGHPVFRYGLTQLISQEPDLEVCWEAASEAEAWRLLEKREPSIAIIDRAIPP